MNLAYFDKTTWNDHDSSSWEETTTTRKLNCRDSTVDVVQFVVRGEEIIVKQRFQAGCLRMNNLFESNRTMKSFLGQRVFKIKKKHCLLQG